MVLPNELDRRMGMLAQSQGIPKASLYAEYMRRAYKKWFKADWKHWDEYGNLVIEE
jgi:hypothetical protein